MDLGPDVKEIMGCFEDMALYPAKGAMSSPFAGNCRILQSPERNKNAETMFQKQENSQNAFLAVASASLFACCLAFWHGSHERGKGQAMSQEVSKQLGLDILWLRNPENPWLKPLFVGISQAPACCRPSASSSIASGRSWGWSRDWSLPKLGLIAVGRH